MYAAIWKYTQSQRAEKEEPMLSAEDNDRLCRVGPGTPMGGLVRQYWLPFAPSTELPTPDGPPKKVRLLGEDLVAFRDSDGAVGLLAEHCPHRGASLFFGRNEGCGLRCVYHGEPTSDPRTRYYTRANVHNDYLRDRALEKDLMIGVPFLVNLQDRAMTETMGPIYDRTQEHLGTTDAMVIYVRRRLLEAAGALEADGTVPANVDDGRLARIRPASALLPEGEGWITATEKARDADAGVPIAAVPLVS
jgi:hypothetical protein